MPDKIFPEHETIYPVLSRNGDGEIKISYRSGERQARDGEDVSLRVEARPNLVGGGNRSVMTGYNITVPTGEIKCYKTGRIGWKSDMDYYVRRELERRLSCGEKLFSKKKD